MSVEGMAVDVGFAIMFGMVVQERDTIKVIAPLGNGRVVHAEEDRILPQCLQDHGQYPLGQSMVDECICDVLAGNRMVITVH